MKIWRPYTCESLAAPPLPLERAEGAYLYLANGQKVLDGISSWWLVTFGHGRTEIAEAVQRQSQSLAQAVFANFSHEPAERLTDALSQLLPAEFSRTFFSDNGSTAVEVAMKMALQRLRLQRQQQRRKFLAFSRSYHGDTCGAMSVSASGTFTAHFKDLLFEILRCEQGHSIHDPLEKWTGDFLRTLDRFGDEIGAVIIEPLIQGAGGMIVWPQAALELICRQAKEHGLLVIFDEVMTGFGRTGQTFAFECLPEDLYPDFLCLSKGLTGGFLPMGLTLTREETFSVFSESCETLYHGHSYTGNALSCAAAAANLRLWLTHSPQSDLARLEAAQRRCLSAERLRSLEIQEARVCGTIGVLELTADSSNRHPGFASRLTERCLGDGVFIRPLGRTIYLMPPFCATDRDLETAWEIIMHYLKRLH